MYKFGAARAVPVSCKALAAAGGGGATGAMAPPLARESGAILSFGPTFEVKEER